ncbi:hypothetical protein BRADI_2g21190v3 [Brachypodium distachyon]|uniref:Reverse transcriptase zinc-binding domain-containing protein n=1 Tax=Brachypodium distachyon TaxID=15368 RepID=I1HI37_BRADI|nr:hypothetical protein BRADI_2g21190v3 [Brachypodium distachyon]
MLKIRIKVRTTLHLQGVIVSDACPYGCGCSETVHHLAFSCPRAGAVWHAFGYPVSANYEVQDLFTSVKELIPSAWLRIWDTMVVSILWNLWQARNRKVFDNVLFIVPMVVRQCQDTFKLWFFRMKEIEKKAARV